MENTQKQKIPETLKPEQMDLSNYKTFYWVIIETKEYKWLIKIDYITEEDIHDLLCYNITNNIPYNNNIPLGINEIKSIRHATKEEVLKYFPDEVFEPIELRPEDLVNGEVYTLVNTKYIRKFTFIHKHYDSDSANPIIYTKMYAHNLKEFHYNSCFSLRLIKIYHATPDEKALLLGEEENSEPTDWKAMYYELKAKYDQLEPKGEKVYFYFDFEDETWQYRNNIDEALERSINNMYIFESKSIGVKKSVLVNE